MVKTKTLSKVMQLMLLLSFMCPVLGFAQNIEIKGTVLDNSKMPVIGASVLEKGTTNGIITDFDGNFNLTVSPNATLSISYVGYKTQEIPVNGKTVFNVTLIEDTELLDEVVVVGYGTMKKSDMTGAITSVDVDDLTKRTTTNPAEALQGKIAGVNIMRTGGNAGAGISVKIRGVKSFGDNEPLYIIDGFPGDIDNVNPSDIQSMEILKDGAAAAIYGSVAANGVVIITTKNGKRGGVKVDFNAYVSMTQIANKLEMTNASQYKSVIKSMFENYNEQYPDDKEDIPSYVLTDNGVDTDWQDAMLRNGLSQNYMVSVRGGGEKAQYSISYNHADDKGIMLGNNYTQDNARIKLHMQKGIFDFDANLGLRYTNSKQPTWSLKEMYAISPLVPIYDDTKEYGYGLTLGGLPVNNNVMADYNYRDRDDKKYFATGNISIGVKLTSWLTFKTGYSYRGRHRRYAYHYQDYVSNPQAPNLYPYHSEQTSYWEDQTFDNVLNFNKEFKKHSISAMAGSSIMSRSEQNNIIYVTGKTTLYSVKDGKLVINEVPAGFPDPSFSTVNAGDGGTFDGEGTKWKYNRASFFGRVNYNYDNRYLLQATVRWDGSSKFGKNNRWGCFPSVALGWRISEEKFFPKNDILNNLKFRLSWGRLGNEGALGNYAFQALVTTYNKHDGGYVQGNGSNAWPGTIAWNMEINDLRWETTDTKNIGFDLGFFNNKLTSALNYYINQTQDLLILKELAPSVGYQSPIMNVGKIQNSGFEFELNWNDKVKDFEYNVGFNMSTIKNEVVSLAEKGQALAATGLLYGTDHIPAYAKEGKPISGFYLYRTDGIFQSMEEVNAHKDKDGNLLQPNARPGDLRFKDIDNNGIIDENDKEYCGTGIPKVELNLNFSASYKGFDISLLLSSALGHKLYNGNKFFYQAMKVPTKMLTSVMDAWTPNNTDTDIPRAVYNDPNNNSRESDRFLESGNFLRMRQAQIGYTFPKSLMNKIKVDNLRLYISGENLFTITGYDGIDPEFSTTSPLDTGIDNEIFPFTRSFTFGAQLTF